MITRTFIVSGYVPYDRAVNAFLAACDLGIDGVYIRFNERITCTLVPANDGNMIPLLLKQQLEKDLGCKQVTVVEEVQSC